jgi:hypothetical protein
MCVWIVHTVLRTSSTLHTTLTDSHAAVLCCVLSSRGFKQIVQYVLMATAHQ